MITLLPEQGRAAVRKEYYIRYAALICIGLGIVLLGVGMALIPAYLEVQIEREIAHAESERLSSMKEVSASAIPQLEELLQVFSGLGQQAVPTEVLSEVLRVKPEGIRISRILFAQANNELIVSGEFASREALLAYAKAVESLPGVDRYTLPLSDLARSEGAPFSLSVYLKQKKHE